MEVVAKTEYQDVYRIKPSSLLVVDKFEKMYPDRIVTCWRCKKTYNPNTQNLYIAEDTYADDNTHIKAGTVIFITTPVVSTSDKSKWRYKIKHFYGNASEMLEMLFEIEDIIKGEN